MPYAIVVELKMIENDAISCLQFSFGNEIATVSFSGILIVPAERF